MPILTLLSAILSSILALILPELIPLEGTFRDFADDDDDFFEKDIKSIKSSDQSSDSSSSNSELSDEVEFHPRRCVRMGVMSVPWMRNQSHVSDLFILDFIIIIFVFVFYQLSASFIPCLL